MLLLEVIPKSACNSRIETRIIPHNCAQRDYLASCLESVLGSSRVHELCAVCCRRVLVWEQVGVYVQDVLP